MWNGGVDAPQRWQTTFEKGGNTLTLVEPVTSTLNVARPSLLRRTWATCSPSMLATAFSNDGPEPLASDLEEAAERSSRVPSCALWNPPCRGLTDLATIAVTGRLSVALRRDNTVMEEGIVAANIARCSRRGPVRGWPAVIDTVAVD